MLLYFSERVARELFDDDEGSRDFERGELFAAAGFQIGRIDGAGGNDIGHGDFATDTVGRGGGGRLRDAILLLEKLLDLARIDVESTGNDEIAFAAAQRVVAV